MESSPEKIGRPPQNSTLYLGRINSSPPRKSSSHSTSKIHLKIKTLVLVQIKPTPNPPLDLHQAEVFHTTLQFCSSQHHHSIRGICKETSFLATPGILNSERGRLKRTALVAWCVFYEIHTKLGTFENFIFGPNKTHS